MRRSLAVASSIASLALCAGGHAAVVTYNFDNVSGGTTPTVTSAPPSSGTPVSNLTIANFVGSGTVARGVYSNSVSNHAGASGVNNFGQYVAPGGSESYSVTFTPASAHAFSITDLDFGIRSTGTGPQAFALQYSWDNFATFSSLGSGTIPTSGTWVFRDNTFTSFTDTVSRPVTVRILLSGGTGTAGSSANSRVDDVRFDVSAVSLNAAPTFSAASYSATVDLGDRSAAVSGSVAVAASDSDASQTLTFSAGSFPVGFFGASFSPATLSTPQVSGASTFGFTVLPSVANGVYDLPISISDGVASPVTVNVAVTVVPEPASLALLGVASALVMRRRR